MKVLRIGGEEAMTNLKALTLLVPGDTEENFEKP
jgi:hypothetical protein